MRSLTWVQLDENEWLLVCVGYLDELTFSKEREIRSKGIGMQSASVISSTATYTWKTYTAYKKGGLTEEDKLYIEDIFNDGN